MLSSCGVTTTTSVDRTVAEICKGDDPLWFIIHYSGKDDTTPTKDQVKKLNARRDAFCK